MVANAQSQPVSALPEQTNTLRLSNRDINHLICVGGEIEDVKFSAEKAIAVERAGADAWIKFLVKETDDQGQVTRSYVTAPSEFFVSCNGAIYPLYAEPADIPAQTVTLISGTHQRATANMELLGPLVEEERAVSITLSLLADRLPASFAETAPQAGPIKITAFPDLTIAERKAVQIDGASLSASEYSITAKQPVHLDERSFLRSELGSTIFALTLDRSDLKAGESARLIVVRRGERP
ncbi:type-F conjugative transfer system secretin TraK [Sphingobium sp. AP50]|uniref:type-F conjugative transfer system secretin TraK n=1 Tax=Sphingobium sp. AP50 TaxID=1884369 RepID=UPI003526CAD5